MQENPHYPTVGCKKQEEKKETKKRAMQMTAIASLPFRPVIRNGRRRRLRRRKYG